MTRPITFALAVVAGFACVNAAGYTPTNVAFAKDLECANCIRSGNNFCLFISSEGTQTV